jgi:hypothetical protein
MLGPAPLFSAEEEGTTEKSEEPEIKTNIDDFMKAPRGEHAIPGPFPGKVVKVTDPASLKEDAFDADVIREMVRKGIQTLTGKSLMESFELFFTPEDRVGLKVNPVGAPLISTRHEVTRAVIEWLVECGLPEKNVVIWDRFDDSLAEAGYTEENYPGIAIEGINDFVVNEDGTHNSADRFDKTAFYRVEGLTGKSGKEEQDEQYLMYHVFNGEESYFGKLVTQKLTKIINLPAYKNTGHGVSMAAKNLGYGSICNTARLHTHAMFFRVYSEVLAAPWVRDKLVLNLLDGLRGQYDGGPGKNAQFAFANHSLYFATDPFALDRIGHDEVLAKRKEMKVKISNNPAYTSYFEAAERLGIGVGSRDKIELVQA